MSGQHRPRAVLLATALTAAVACATPPAPVPAANMQAASWPSGPLVDLSHAYGADTIFWPTAEGFSLETVAAGMTPQGYYYAANTFASAEHGGTHLDAPIHFAEGRHAVEQIPLDRLVGEAAVIDVGASADANPDYQVTIDDFTAWETAHGSLHDTIILVRTGYSRRWPDAARYLGTAERGPEAVARLHFPGIHPDAARWLAGERRVKAVGIDTASIDYGQSTLFESHRALYERDIPGFENLANLHELPPRGATLVALPMKIAGGSGAPLRAIAILPPAPPTTR